MEIVIVRLRNYFKMIIFCLSFFLLLKCIFFVLRWCILFMYFGRYENIRDILEVIEIMVVIIVYIGFDFRIKIYGVFIGLFFDCRI